MRGRRRVQEKEDEKESERDGGGQWRKVLEKESGGEG